MDPLLEQLSTSSLSIWIRTSVWVFPLINTGHVFGLSLLFGSIIVVDLRLLGVGRRLAMRQLADVLLPISILGFLLAVGTGLLMFLVDPVQYWSNTYFLPKMTMIALSGLNVAILHVTSWRLMEDWGDSTPLMAKGAGLLSMLFWSATITAGRLMAYF